MSPETTFQKVREVPAATSVHRFVLPRLLDIAALPLVRPEVSTARLGIIRDVLTKVSVIWVIPIEK